MNVLFDATWIGSHYKKEMMHGGLRVIHELTKRLESSPEIDLFYASNKYDLAIIHNIQAYIKDHKYAAPIDKIGNNTTAFSRLMHAVDKKLNRFFKKKLGIPFSLDVSLFDRRVLEKMDIYHSALEAIPDEIKRYTNVKRVFTSHDLMPFTRPDLAPASFKEVLQPAYQSIDGHTKVICVSEFTKSELLNFRKDLKESQVEVVYLGADREIFSPNQSKELFEGICKKYGFSFEKYFLCLNRNQKYKNTEHIIEAYINLINQYSLTDIGLVLIGTFDSLESKNLTFNKYKNYNNIHFIEFVPDGELSVFYSNAICFVYMSLYEGFGLPILEAMQCGAPVISSNCASLPEVVGSAGICIDPFDKDLLSSQMELVLANIDLQKQLASNSIDRSRFFSWEKNVLQTKEVYKKASHEY